MSRKGRPNKIGEAEQAVLRQIVADKPTATTGEVVLEFTRRTGMAAHEATVCKGLREAGVYRSKAKVVRQSEPATQPARYGYQDWHRTQGSEQGYASSFTDAEWALVADIFDNREGRGIPPRYPRRALVDACCYVVRTGCSWRMLPREFPPWKNVYRTFRRWAAEGRFEAMHDRLRNQWREREGRSPGPTAAVLDAESTRSSPQDGPAGFDAGKKVKGRKRNLVVDTLGLLLAVTVTAANVQDRDGAPQPVEQATAKYPGLQSLFVDNGYAGQCAAQPSTHYNLNVDVVRHPANRNVGYWRQPGQGELFAVPADHKGFTVLPKRWGANARMPGTNAAAV